MAICIIPVVGVAPCQCFSPGGNQTTSPGRIASTGLPSRCAQPSIGSGFNLPFYGPQVGEIVGLDPSPQLLTRARNNAKQAHRDIQLLNGFAECIPLDDRSLDIVLTLAL